jgi:hypothetical protein
MLLIVFAPEIGLGAKEEFILYHLFGLSRGHTLLLLAGFLCVSCAFQLFSLAIPAAGKTRWSAIIGSIPHIRSLAIETLFKKENSPVGREELAHAIIVAVFFALMFLILLFKSIASILQQNDFHYHQAFLDYDIDWSTPAFSLTGNLLFNFNIQIPLNASLSPLSGLARLLSPAHSIVITLTLFYAGFSVLIWSIGKAIGLRPVPRVFLAGTVALIVTIPNGLDQIIFVTPPYFLTHLLSCGLWWGELALLSLTTVYLFFWLGQQPSVIMNLALGFGISVLCFVMLFALSEGAFFVIPVILFYCLAFQITARWPEFLWKAAVGSVLAAVMLLTHVPSYFSDLYSYTHGVYFTERAWSWGADFQTLVKIRPSSIAFSLNYDFRVPLFVLVSLGTLCVCFWRGTGALKRIAGAVLFSEACIVSLGYANALTFKLPTGSFFYSEELHEAFLATFFVLFLLFIFTMVGLGLKAVIKNISEQSKDARFLGWIIRKRVPLLFTCLFIGGLVRAATLPRATGFHFYPAKQPLSVQIIKRQLTLEPGSQFPGRLLILAATRAEPGEQWLVAPGSILDVLELQYKVVLGNDHYVNLLPFSIPIANEFAHWTSPVTFIFLRSFFGRTGDGWGQVFFPLRDFNERIARLFGIRMVVTDAPDLPGATLVYESKAGTADLRIFSINHVNLGQYSPTRPTKILTATEAIAALAAASFNPERDVLVEAQVPDDLVSASQVSVITELGPTLSIRAESSGRSLLVLPFEYSHCMLLEVQDGASAQIIPVNLQQTGLLFEKSVTAKISYRFGLFDHPHCRREDMQRADRLRLRNALK